MAKKKTAKRAVKSRKSAGSRGRKNSLALAATSLILNVLIFPLPGIGSLLGGKVKIGIWQIVLGIVGSLMLTQFTPVVIWWVGFFVWLFAWVWGIVTGVQLIREAQ